MMKKALIAAAMLVGAGQASAGGVTIHNYTGEHVNVLVGKYLKYNRCSGSFGDYCGDSGKRVFATDTRSTAQPHYVAPGKSLFIEDDPIYGGGYMQIFAVAVQKGDYSTKRRHVWHGGIAEVPSPTLKYSSWKLCNSWSFTKWNKHANRPSNTPETGRAAWDPAYCRTAYPFYWYTGTNVLQYDLVLTPQNAQWGTY